MNNNTAKRGWVKDVAIIFLVIMLILTFFSNTILNWSLPQVSGRYGGYGSVSTSIRGTGTVQANLAYSVTIEETRRIKQVLVKQGDTVEQGQSLFLLEDSESEELKAARETLEEMEYNYKVKQLQGSEAGDYSDAEWELQTLRDDLAASNTDLESVLVLEAQQEEQEALIKAATRELDDLNELVAEKQEEIAAITGGEAEDSEEVAAKLTALETAQGYLDAAKESLEDTENEIALIEASMDIPYKTAVANAESAKKAYDTAVSELEYYQKDYSSMAGDYSSYQSAYSRVQSARRTVESAQKSATRLQTVMEDAKAEAQIVYSGSVDSDIEYKALVSEQEAYTVAVNTYENAKSTYESLLADETADPADVESAKDAMDNAQNVLASLTDKSLVIEILDAYRKAKSDYKDAVKSYEGAQSELTSAENALNRYNAVSDGELSNMERTIEKKKEEINELKAELDKARQIMTSLADTDKQLNDLKEKKTSYQKKINAYTKEVAAAQKALDNVLSDAAKTAKAELNVLKADVKEKTNVLDDMKEALADITEQIPSSSEQLKSTIKSLERQIRTAEASVQKQKDSDDKSAVLTGLENQRELKKIEKQKELITELEKDAIGSEITARYAGIISSVSCIAGETVQAGAALAGIDVEGKGYTLDLTVTNAQAAQVHVGDRATIANYYWGNDITATVGSIKPDRSNPGKSKIISFDISGSVTEGQQLTLSVGEKQTYYDMVVPNSAVHEDANGKYIFISTVKSTPLGNRYIAKRVDVTVLAKDNINTAVDAGTEYGYEYVIATTSAPIEDGSQVRLVDNG